MTNFPVVFKEFSFFAASRRKLLKKVLFFSPLRGENCLKKCLTKKSHQNCLKTYLTFLDQKLLKKMFKNRVFLEELLKKLLNDFAASRRKLLKNPFLSNFSCLKKHCSCFILACSAASPSFQKCANVSLAVFLGRGK